MSLLQDHDPMPFGKHKGWLMHDVPAEYLHWLWTNPGTGTQVSPHTAAVRDYIRRNLPALKVEHPDGIWT